MGRTVELKENDARWSLAVSRAEERDEIAFLLEEATGWRGSSSLSAELTMSRR